MTTPQDQYMEWLREGQRAVVQAMESWMKSWTKSAQKAFGTSNSSPAGTVNPDIIID
jgi:hypothetical protein